MTDARLWYLYIVETADSTFYTGITTDLTRRMKAHNSGHGAKYTAKRGPVVLLAAWQTIGQGQALKLEIRLKRLSRDRKQRLIASGNDFESAQRFNFELNGSLHEH